MTTQDLIEQFIDAGMRAYKKNYKRKNCSQARRLDRHEPVMINGVEDVTFHYWREVVVYKMAEYIQEILPDAEVNMILDGNNSTIELTITDEEQRTLNSKLYVFLHQMRIL